MKRNRQAVLDRETLELLGSATSKAEITGDRLARLRNRIISRVEQVDAVDPPFVTIREDEGTWIEIAPSMEKKVLAIDEQVGTESYLLRIHPDARPDAHHHEQDELCVVLQGDISFDDIRLKAGDFHVARKGTWHGPARTVDGAVLFIQAALSAAA
ncbi:MAG: cupin domain-containing protein [Woeseiaceae bacterium]|nr:cupin domain-containing protein [Woeseiaceae bacterium]